MDVYCIKPIIQYSKKPTSTTILKKVKESDTIVGIKELLL